MTDIDRVIDEAKVELLPFESWEQLPGESSAAYAAFCAYRDFGPGRNIRRAVEGQFRFAELPLAGLTAKKYRVWRGWSMRFKWRERAEEYDQYLDRLKQTELRKTIEAQAEVHRMVTGKMLHVVCKKLDMMEPGELPSGAVPVWVDTAIDKDRELAGLVGGNGGKDKQDQKSGQITFFPEFDGC
jgi:hypothetical protein